ncbi:MAG: DUF885 domain-containing protein [Thermoplasmata archaeon]|nr:DUF885 domain-containing protein [Thermoplasmata archaeon]
METTGTAASAGSGEAGELERSIVDHVFRLQPGYAVFLGLHQYDGLLPDLSEAFTERWTAEAEHLLEQVRAVPADPAQPDRGFDHLLLELLLESPRFDLLESRELERNPMSYLGALSLTSYMVREYAPLGQRVAAMVRTLEGVPRLLEQGRRRLGTQLPKPFVELSLAIGSGLPTHFQEAESYARSGGAELVSRLAEVRGVAEGSVREFLGWLKSDLLPRSVDDFALGPERYRRLLWVREGIRTPVDEILRAGRADLEGNQARLEELARGRRPPTSPAALLDDLYPRHPTADRLLATAGEMVEEMRKFTADHHLATIPGPALCRVEETPTYGRSLSTASMNPPGPFDVSGDVGVYYITPVDPAWTPERQEEWLRVFNDAMLLNITAHEVFPGHYLQFLHHRRAANRLVRKVFLSAAFTEGWAHYCEQLTIEQDLRHRSVEAEAAQLHDALLRNCRLVASIGLHTEGMDLESATQLFMREGHLERLPAEREAIRGTFNPEYFCYTLGKLAILEARTKYLASKFDGSLLRFHDRLLSFGSPPVGLLDGLLAAG